MFSVAREFKNEAAADIIMAAVIDSDSVTITINTPTGLVEIPLSPVEANIMLDLLSIAHKHSGNLNLLNSI